MERQSIQQILWTNIGEISRRLPGSVIGPILDHLISQGAITAVEYQLVCHISPVPSQKAKKLVEILASKGRQEFNVFTDSLKKNSPDLLRTIMPAPIRGWFFHKRQGWQPFQVLPLEPNPTSSSYGRFSSSPPGSSASSSWKQTVRLRRPRG
ncbi:uncharacterized protein LOC144861628 [Branchiostoma floridae x Branchiostoma japonicum]